MNPILIDFPNKIETGRLYMRPCRPGDGNIVFESVIASQNELKPWLPFAQFEQSLENTEASIREAYADFMLKKDFRLLIFRKEDDQFIGSTGLHRINWDIPKCEIGYWIDSRQSKNGYITEAVQALTNFAFDFLKAKRIEIRVDPNNIASVRIPKKLGFVLEGILRQYQLSADKKELCDTCVYAKIKC